MPISYADADDQRTNLFPSGVYSLKAEVLIGNYGEDNTLMLASSKRTMHVALVCTVTDGEYKGRKIYDNVTVALDKTVQPPVDTAQLNKYRTAVRIGRARIKAIINSARGLDPNDKSPDTEAKRSIETHEELTGMVFWAEIGEEPPRGAFRARNRIDRIVEPCDDDYPKAAAQAVAVAAPPAKAATGNGSGATKPPPAPSSPPAQGGPASLRGEMDDDIPFACEWR